MHHSIRDCFTVIDWGHFANPIESEYVINKLMIKDKCHFNR